MVGGPACFLQFFSSRMHHVPAHPRCRRWQSALLSSAWMRRCDLRSSTNGRIRVLHVLDRLSSVTGFETAAVYLDDVLPLLEQEGYSLLERAKARVDAAGVPVETHLVECVARRTSEIINEQADAWRADLIVLGTHGRRGARRLLLGSDAETSPTHRDSTRPAGTCARECQRSPGRIAHRPGRYRHCASYSGHALKSVHAAWRMAAPWVAACGGAR